MIMQTKNWKYRWVLLAICLCLVVSVATLTQFRHAEAQVAGETEANLAGTQAEPSTVTPAQAENQAVSIDGSITLDGKPLGEVFIGFRHTRNPRSSVGTNANGDGRFLIASTFGLQPGEYRVWLNPMPDKDNTLKVAIPEKYQNLNTTPFVVQLNEGRNMINFELTDSLVTLIPPLPVDPNYIELLTKRAEVAKIKFEHAKAAHAASKATRVELAETELALAEAEYALKQAQRGGDGVGNGKYIRWSHGGNAMGGPPLHGLSRTPALQTLDQQKLKMLVLAMLNHHDARGTLPSSSTAEDGTGKPMHSWRVALLPYLEQSELHMKIRHDEPWDSEYNKQFHPQTPDCYRSPYLSDEQASKGLTNYVVIVGGLRNRNTNVGFVSMPPELSWSNASPDAIGAVFPSPNSWNTLARVSDGVSRTILIAQRSEPVNWMDPTGDVSIRVAVQGINAIKNGLGSLDGSEGINVAFCDGATSFAPSSGRSPMLEAALTCNGDESVQWEPEKLRP